MSEISREGHRLMTRRNDGPLRIGESLAALARRFSRSDLMGVAAIEEHWVELIGEPMASHTRALALRGTTLVVAADQPAWATQVRLHAGSLAPRVSELAKEQIDTVEVVVKAR